jgi:RNA polymerase sigma factor (sigma-70 family)
VVDDSTESQALPVGEARAGNADAALLDTLVREHRAAAVAYAWRILGDASLAEDAVQRALLQILLRVRAGDDQLLVANPRAVVLRGTRWAALKLADRHSSRDEAERRAAEEVLDHTGGDDHDWDRLEARMLVEDILPSLPEHYRDVLRLRYLEGRPDATAAQDLAVTLKAYRRRLDRALVVARVAALRIGVTSLGATLATLLRRGRTRVQRFVLASDHSAWSPVGAGSPSLRSSMGHVILAVALVGLVVGTPVARHAGGSRGAPPHAVAQRPGADHATLAAGAVAAAPAAGHLSRALALVGSRDPVAGPPSRPTGETIDDVDVFQVVPAPQAADNHTAVAEGQGRRCVCAVFAQTTDGGATWAVYPAPGAEPMLPPDYPRDPRIFLRSSPQLYNLVGVCIEQRISDGTCSIAPGVPNADAGPMVFDPRFDAGVPVLYVSTAGGVVAYNMATGLSKAVELNTSETFSGMWMVAAGGPGQYSIFVIINGVQPAAKVAPPTKAGAPGDAAPWVGAPHLVGCRSDGSCARLADLPRDSYALYSDFGDSGTVVTFAGFSLDVVSELGAVQHVVPAPNEDTIVSVQALSEGARLEVDALAETPDWTRLILESWRPERGWQISPLDIGSGDTNGATQATQGWDRLIVAEPVGGGGGLACTSDGGRHWARYCSAE